MATTVWPNSALARVRLQAAVLILAEPSEDSQGKGTTFLAELEVAAVAQNARGSKRVGAQARLTSGPNNDLHSRSGSLAARLRG